MAHPPFAHAWLAQRELGAAAMEELESAELRQLDAATALAQTEMLLSAVRLDDLPEERRTSSGFVEQQLDHELIWSELLPLLELRDDHEAEAKLRRLLSKPT